MHVVRVSKKVANKVSIIAEKFQNWSESYGLPRYTTKHSIQYTQRKEEPT